jgi:glycosyltransferase involved in cell wall biosynthesis
MRSVLIVSYYYPPHGGAGVHRTVALARHLHAYGWDPVVLAGPRESSTLWSPLDPVLEDELRGTRVVRIESRAPLASKSRRRVSSLLGRPTDFEGWFEQETVRVASRLPRSVDVVLGELGPYPCAGGISKVASLLAAPLVLDLQDPWAFDEMWVYPSRLHRRADMRRMRDTLRGADAVIMNTPEAAAVVRDAFGELGTVCAIPNGFDAGDFSASSGSRNEVFTIVHTGTLHTAAGMLHLRRRRLRKALGGLALPDVDFLSRSHVYLMQALRLVLADARYRGRIRVLLAGAGHAGGDMPSEGIVQNLGFLPHGRTVELMRSADLLFLPMHDLPRGTRARIVPAKTYEYVASGRPILAAVPDGDARQFLDRVGTATLVRPRDVEGLAEAIRESFAAWERDVPPARADPAQVAEREWSRLVGRIGRVLDSVHRPGAR